MVATQGFIERLQSELDASREAGTYKTERLITGPQGSHIAVSDGGAGSSDVLNFCANNYLGLSSHPDLIAAAHEALEHYGYGLSSVRFICGTQTPHRELERRLAEFLGFEDAILYTSCFDANGGVFETLLTDEDAIISDALNHASIIDGIRLCKAQRHRYAHDDMQDLERCLKAASGARTRLVVTDGVFSMDGDIARLDKLCELAEAHDALVLVDDSHATGFVGQGGRGTPEHCGVMGRVSILTSTLGKALGGASGGFTAGPRAVVDLLRQRSRPYLFSNSVAPMIVGASLKALDLISGSNELRDQLRANTTRFRSGMTEAGFDIRPGVHPIVPVMLGDAKLATAMAADMLEQGIYVIGFCFPVVPRGQARIRVQLSAAHSSDDVDRAIAAFIKVGRAHGVLS
ncbi:MAG: glycine C-acetyltransferase [Planctomycetota bacterium]|nr:MAG: glycine C-acetyltransferase [Planctomycetota bacterium]